MAHKKTGGSAKSGKTSQSKRLGVKVFGGQFVKPGMIIVRQKGVRFHPGQGTKIGRDHTIFSTAQGYVQFTKKKVTTFTGKLKLRQFVNVIPKKS